MSAPNILSDILSDPTTKWMLIVVGTLTIIYLVVRPAMRKKDPLARRGPIFSLARQRDVEQQMQNVLVELSQMARELTAQLDTRAAKLEALIKEADQKIAALRRGEQTSSRELPVEELPREELPALPPDPRHERVYALADQGRSAREIAAELNRPSGEIELILALRH